MSIQGHGGGQQGGHGGGQFSQSGHHNLHIGDLSNDNMLGGDYQYWNISNFMEGLKINTGIRFAILFIAFAGWLYVIYWIRHHEPFINQMIGTRSNLAPTAAQDRSIVAAVKTTFPWKTSPDMGTLYVPSPEPPEKFKEFSNSANNEFTQTAPLQSDITAQNKITMSPGQAIAAPIEYSKPNFDERFGLPLNSQTNYVVPTNSPILDSYTPNYQNQTYSNQAYSNQTYSNQNYPTKLNSNATNFSPVCTNYRMPARNGQSTLLRTVVSR